MHERIQRGLIFLRRGLGDRPTDSHPALKGQVFPVNDLEDVESLLYRDIIEQLVRKGRIPFRIGTVGNLLDKRVVVRPFYAVPPFSKDRIVGQHIGTGGAPIFTLIDGNWCVGPTYSLTPRQADILEARVKAESTRLAQLTQKS